MTPATANVTTTIDIPATSDALLEEARAASAGRAGHTLVPGGHAPLKQVLLALTAGTVIADHESPGAATLHVLTGRVRLTADDLAQELGRGAFTSIPPVRHGVEALEDAVVLLTVAQRQDRAT
jgi:quercetin dioxygenase-like cupin family protein